MMAEGVKKTFRRKSFILFLYGSTPYRGLKSLSAYGRGDPCGQYISLKAKRGEKADRKLRIWHTARKETKLKELSMYRLREMDVDDKVCEQVSLTMMSQ